MILTYTEEQAFMKLVKVIKEDKRHDNYKRTVDLAKLYRQLITHEEINELLQQFVRREDEIMFNQRVAITKHITKSVTESLMSVFYKVTRSNSIMLLDKYKDDTQNRKLDELKETTNNFYGDESVREYLEDKLVDLVHLDPNAWIITEFLPTDGKERAMPYPFEVTSEQAIYYEKINNILQFIVTRIMVEQIYMESGELKKGLFPKYTIYTKDQAISLQLNPDDRVKLANEGQKGNYLEQVWIRINKKNYIIDIPLPYSQESVPAICVGYKGDKVTNGQTFVNPFDAAVPYLLKSIKSVSEMDLTQSLHAFPQKIQAVTRCEFESCNAGYLADGDKCPVCLGTGFNIITSAQDMIALPMPRSKEEQLDIGNIIQYISPPTDIIRWMDEYIDKLIVKCKMTVFNADVYSRTEIAETATAKVIDLQAVYDTLYPFAVKYAKTWVFITYKCAEITDQTEGLIVKYHVNKDFKLKSMDDLIAELKELTGSGASNILISEVQKDIAEVMYQDRPLELKKYNLMESFYPFSGKSKEQIAAIVNNLPLTHPKRVLWMFYGVIFDEILEEYADYFEKPREKQRAIIDEKVEAYAATLQTNKPNLDLND